MIDQVSNKGYARISAPATVTSSAAGSAVLNLLLGPGGSSFVNSPTLGQPQGTVAFVLDTTAVTGSGSYLVAIQTGTDNTNFTNVSGGLSVSVTNVANTGGLQAIFIDSAALSQYTRAYDYVTGTVSVVRAVSAVFIPKNP